MAAAALAAALLLGLGSVDVSCDSKEETSLPVNMVAPPQSDPGDWGGCSDVSAAHLYTAVNLCAYDGKDFDSIDANDHVDDNILELITCATAQDELQIGRGLPTTVAPSWGITP